MSGRPLRSALALAVALAVLLVWPLTATAAGTVAFTIRDSRITESSGLAADPAAQVYWTANDSGGRGVAYALSASGKVEGTLNYRAAPRDVEAVAMHDRRLYLADIGDNGRRRDLVTVYAFENPQAHGLTVTYRSYDFRYPDGAHDAETLLVSPTTGRLYVVTKEAGGGGVYAAPKQPQRVGVNTLTRVGDAPPMVTDGTFLPGGDRIALLTYDSVIVLDGSSYAEVARSTIPKQRQAESLAVSLDQGSLLVGSEGRRSPVISMPVPGASPSPSPSSDTGQADIPEDDAATNGPSRSGTFLALGLAALVSVVAGAVVVLVRRS